MRIFLSAQQSRRSHPVPGYAFWEYYFKNALAELGHEVIEAPDADWAEGLTQLSSAGRAAWLDRTWTTTVDTLRAAQARQRVDLFLAYLFPGQVEPAALRTIHSLGIPTVNFFCDNVREFTCIPRTFSGFTLHWVPEAEARMLYATAGLPHLYAPMPVWIPPHLRSVPARENADVVFLGSHDILREELLGEAVARGLPLKLHGDGWLATDSAPPPDRSLLRTLRNQAAFLREHGVRGLAMRASYQLRRRRPTGWIKDVWQPAKTGDAYFQATRESLVVIGINRYTSFRHPASRPHSYSRLRDIEAPMLGACYLTEATPGLGDLYELGAEIETYANAAELVEKAAILRGDPGRRAALRRRGQQRALRDHSIARSIEKLCQHLGLLQ